ncbi:MAG: NAD synthetase [Candidatus Glassbacteria bacterium GWA2_58_10]|uniref:NAD(P) transhydrogenase subunit beta n=1 Tax=Candidatus Glassbacteria bacterium GWA2_58_10 TaxID=1817865 RepID=A0A1F5YDB6_9BACT|nr:MAG: NAD synthetase [Candidatus Glassbacteria bacterium GWA2_58_10]
MKEAIINLSYLTASVMFIFCLKDLAHPRTAIRGNLIGALGMLLAIVVTLFDRNIVSYNIIIYGVILGTIAGYIIAMKIKMTGMPQLVAILNGFGGGASVLVAGAAMVETGVTGDTLLLQTSIATAASGIIGAVTFWGSMVAFLKLQEMWIPGNPVLFRGQHLINLVLLLIAIGLGTWLVLDPSAHSAYWYLVILSSILGLLIVIPIGGADMPVVIALLNSYSGIAGATTGFVLNNNGLIIAGALVGASGIILSKIMCKAMNRSLTNVLFGGVGSVAAAGPGQGDIYAGKVKSASAEELAMILDDARQVMIVPGYGMAVAQAQHPVRDLTNLLESKGIKVNFAIHPVAGRMPGHMNILLAEAGIPYEKLKEMDESNSMMESTDVSIVLGANDVVNPIARTDPKSPIAGMPIIDVDKSRTVVIIKRSLASGFAGIPNPLFVADNSLMYFGDGKKAILDLIQAVKEG